MSRSYGEKFLQEINSREPTTLGLKLGLLCVKAHIPAAHIAALLGVSRMTVFSWFRGTNMNDVKKPYVELLISAISRDLIVGKLLPVESPKQAKEYLETIINTKG